MISERGDAGGEDGSAGTLRCGCTDATAINTSEAYMLEQLSRRVERKDFFFFFHR